MAKKTDKVTFTIIDHFLRGLGFARYTDEKGFAFHHEPSRAIIFLRKFKDDEELSPTDLAIVRHHLDWYGIMPRDEFEHRVHSGTLVV